MCSLYVLAINLEGNIIERKAVYLPPALTLIAQMFMYQLENPHYEREDYWLL